MTGESLYLICRVGRYSISIMAQTVFRIWPADRADPDYSASSAPVDLRAALDGDVRAAGIAVAFEMADAVGVLFVDAVSGMANIAEEAFEALPEVFCFAGQLFDAACRSPIGGAYPLRLRRQPGFAALPL
jgi:hypothetical protein